MRVRYPEIPAADLLPCSDRSYYAAQKLFRRRAAPRRAGALRSDEFWI